MENKVYEFIKKNNLIDKGEAVGVALSGGCDSMALLFLLKRLGYNVTALHFEHGIRGEESLRDAYFCHEYCKKNGIPIVMTSADVPAVAREKKETLEGAARKLRYDFFAKSGMDKIATAHHMDDNAESVIMNMVRGCGVNGLCGIDVRRGNIIRPFLCVSRAEIEEYARQNGIEYVTDSTNSDTSYRRNMIRKEIIPKFKEMNPNFLSAVMRMCESAADACGVVREKVEKIGITKLDENSVCVDKAKLDGVNRETAAQVIFNMCDMVESRVDVESSAVEKVLNLDRTGAFVHIKHGIYAKYEYGKLIVFKKQDIIKRDFINLPYSESMIFEGGRIEKTDKAPNFENQDKFCESFEGIPEGAVLRTRAPGDVFSPFGSGEKKLKDYFIDAKIPREKRNEILLLADGNEIIWVVGYAISKKYAVKDEKKAVTLKYTKDI